MNRPTELLGVAFGRLTVTALLPNSMCSCDCSCGTRGHVTARYSIRHGLCKSCGCIFREKSPRLNHGEATKGQWTPEYRAWTLMNTRCYNPKCTRYKNWGGRGIQVCGEWRNDYRAFLAYVGRKPTQHHSLDRYPNNDGNYEPGNVRWATRSEQARNSRPRKLATNA